MRMIEARTVKSEIGFKSAIRRTGMLDISASEAAIRERRIL